MRKISLLLTPLLLSILMGCGKDDSSPGGLEGTWELSEIIFETASSSASLSNKRSQIFTMEFKGDNTLTTEGTNIPKNYSWKYDATVLTISSDNGDQTYELIEDGSSFQYVSFTAENMNTVEVENRQIVELAASTFNQQQKKYDPNGSLTVHFKFKKL